MNKEIFSKCFPFGTHLCREPMPSMREMKNDMELMKKSGFNLIKLQEIWAVDEPKEGQFDFSKYEELIDHAAKLQLGVYLGLTCEQAPNWLWEKHPGCRMIGKNGIPIAYQAQFTLPADGKPGPCYDHAGAMDDQLRFITKLVSELGKFENIVVWNTWQEIGYWTQQLLGQEVCYCEHTIAHFREWLECKYMDLDGLNRAWNSRYANFSDIQPDRIGIKLIMPHHIDWKYFLDNVRLEKILKARKEAICAADPLQRPVFAHLGSSTIGSGAQWTYARSQDFLGSSCYPAWHCSQGWDDVLQGKKIGYEDAMIAEVWESIALNFDYLRSCNVNGAPIWAAELQGGPISTGFQIGRKPSGGDIRRWMLSAVGSGVSAISFWVTRAEIAGGEQNGFGLLDSEGESTERLEEASKIGRALGRHADLFANADKSDAKVAILINDWNYQLCQTIANGGNHLLISIRGWHRMLWDAGIPVDFVEASTMEEQQIHQYKALILPFPISISEQIAGKLAAYVADGGNLISEACPGRLSENGYANRGELSPTLRALFGVSVQHFQMCEEPEDGHRWSPKERTWGEYAAPAMLVGTGEFAQMALRANVYIQTFICHDETRPILEYGHCIAGTVREHGQGKAYLLGTFAGHNGTAYRDEKTRAFIAALLKECEVDAAHSGKLLMRRRSSEYKQALILTNPTNQSITEQILVKGFKSAEDLYGNALPIDEGILSLTVQGMDVEVIILQKR